jgi:hypothetical protein
MSDHLDTSRIDRYRRRAMAPEELLAADDHLAACTACRERAGETEEWGAAWDNLLAELSEHSDAKPEHLSYEHLAAYVDGTLDEVGRELVESHISICGQCASEVHDVFDVAKALGRTGRRFEKLVALLGWRALFSRAGILGRFEADWPLVPLRAYALAASVILVVIAGSVWVRQRQPHGQPSTSANLAASKSRETLALKAGEKLTASQLSPNTEVITLQSPPAVNMELLRRAAIEASRRSAPQTPNVVATPVDGGPRGTINIDGNLAELESIPEPFREAVRAGLAGEAIYPAQLLSELVSGTGFGRVTAYPGGAQARAIPIRPVGVIALEKPVATVVLSDVPIFAWSPVSGATSYRVSVFNSMGLKVVESPPLTATIWSPPAPLARGEIYAWRVMKDADPKAALSVSPEARFKVLEGDTAEKLEQIRTRFPRSPLTLGAIYAQAGLLDDAQSEFEALAESNPRSIEARKLLLSVIVRRRSQAR